MSEILGDLEFVETVRLLENSMILGCSGFAGMYAPIGDDIPINILVEAFEQGICQLDTAPHYGLGLGEERLGRALRTLGSENCKDFKIWSKVGRIICDVVDVTDTKIDEGNIPGTSTCIFPETPSTRRAVFDYSEIGACKSHRDSLQRLNCSQVYGLRVHDCENEESFLATVDPRDGGLQALVKLREAGEIADVSIGVNNSDYALRILKDVPSGTLNSIMIAGCWNLLEQQSSCLELLIKCQLRGIQVHIAGVFASGILVGGTTYRYSAASSDLIHKTLQWMELAQSYDVPLPAVAIAFALLPKCVEAIAVGVKSVEELRSVCAWMRTSVPVQLFYDARARGLLESFVPLPSTSTM